MQEMGELVQLMQSYLRGASTIDDCAEWLAGVDWDDPELTEDETEALGGFVLVLTEISDGIRDESEFKEDVRQFVASRIGFVFQQAGPQEFDMAPGTTTSASRPERPSFTVVSPVARSWSI